jgi:hypothetical protein
MSGRHCTRKRRFAMAKRPEAANAATGSVRYVNPEGLHKYPVFTDVVVVEGCFRALLTGGASDVELHRSSC